MPIKALKARQIYDSRGNPTLEVEVFTEKGVFRASAPSGSSSNAQELLDMRDREPKFFHGRGVSRAIDGVNKVIAPEMVAGVDETNQYAVDRILLRLDDTDNKARLGANATYAVSVAICKAGAMTKGIPVYQHIAQLLGNENLVIPIPIFTLILGGSNTVNRLSPQELYIIPSGASCFNEAMKMGSEVYHFLRIIISKKYGLDSVNIADEGAFCPPVDTIHEALELIRLSIDKAGYLGKIQIGINMGSNNMFKEGVYDIDYKNLKSDPAKWINSEELIDLYRELQPKFFLSSIEDGYAHDDWNAWVRATCLFRIQISAADFLVSNFRLVKKAVDLKACNCMVLKPNQTGSVSEALEVYKLIFNAGWSCSVSHNVGETEDTFLADFAVGISAGQIKCGAPARGERVCKYNQLLRIEEELGSHAVYAGKGYRNLRTFKKSYIPESLNANPIQKDTAKDVVKEAN